MNNVQQIAQGWASYAKSNSLKPTTKKYHEMQHAYVNGVACILGAVLPPSITIYIMCGRDIAELAKPEEATA